MLALDQAALFRGTLAPFLRASESPMAIACLRLVTLPPLPPFPERSVPRFFRRTALATDLPAALPYLRLPVFLERFLVAIVPPKELGSVGVGRGCVKKETQPAASLFDFLVGLPFLTL
jgi:hypothetical protein